MQILRQCEDLVKLKIRKDEDNSGMCLRDPVQWPAVGEGWRACAESLLPAPLPFRALRSHYKAPQSVRCWQDI